MQIRTLSWLDKCLQNERNFVTFSLISLGIPGAVGLVFGYSDYGGFGFWLFLVLVAFFGAYLWGLIMWHFFVKGYSGRQK